MDIRVYLIATLSCLLIRAVSTQQVTVSVSVSRERIEEGDGVAMFCDVSGDGFMGTDSVIIRKISDTSSEIVISKDGSPEAWQLRGDELPGGKLTLLIPETIRSDNGEYACTVLRQPGSTTLAEQTINLDVLYLPDLPALYPICVIDPIKLTYLEGDVVTLTCSSLLGNPIPQLNWSRSDGIGIPTSEVAIGFDTITLEISVALSLDDDDMTFTCNVRSEEFPEYQDSCAIPSLKVISRPTTNMPIITTTRATTKSDTASPLPTIMSTTVATTFSATTKTESTSKTVTHPNTRTSRFTTSTKTDLITMLRTQTKNTDTASKSVATTSNANRTAAASNDALKIGVIAGSIVGVVLLAITIVSLYFVIRSDRCCGAKSKNGLPPSAYAHEVSLDEVQDSYVGIGNEGTTAHVRAPNSNQLYAVVNRNRNSVSGGTQRSASIRDDYSDPPPYPGPPDEGSHDAPLYGSTRTENAISSSRPSIDEVAQRHLYDITPSDHEEEDDEEASIDSAKASNDKPSYYADLDLSEFGGTLRPNRTSVINDSGPYSSVQLSSV